MDTTRAQEVLGFQHHSWPDMLIETADNAGIKRPLLRVRRAAEAKLILKRQTAYHGTGVAVCRTHGKRSATNGATHDRRFMHDGGKRRSSSVGPRVSAGPARGRWRPRGYRVARRRPQRRRSRSRGPAELGAPHSGAAVDVVDELRWQHFFEHDAATSMPWCSCAGFSNIGPHRRPRGWRTSAASRRRLPQRFVHRRQVRRPAPERRRRTGLHLVPERPASPPPG